MVKLLTIFSIILALVLFPPAALALISNNAVPGDNTYPIKRSLEDGIYAVASLNPITKAWFAQARSDRRFKEFSALVTQGKAASNTLNELVSQTDVAAEEIKKIDDPIKKQQLADQLIESINKYDQGLAQASNQVATKQLANPSPVAPTQKPAETTAPINTTTPKPTPSVISSPKPSAPPVITQPRPTIKPTPIPTPTSTTQPSPIPAVTTPSAEHPTQPTPIQSESTDIEKAREDLDKIRDKLKIKNENKKEEKSTEEKTTENGNNQKNTFPNNSDTERNKKN